MKHYLLPSNILLSHHITTFISNDNNFLIGRVKNGWEIVATSRISTLLQEIIGATRFFAKSVLQLKQILLKLYSLLQ